MNLVEDLLKTAEASGGDPTENANDYGDDDDVEHERHPPSSRLRWDAELGVSVFEGIEQGAFHANISDLSAIPSPNDFRYDDGFEVVDGSKPIGTIVKFIGEGAMGTVHLFQPSEEGAVPCAAKSVRADVCAKARLAMEQQLAVEV